MRHYVAATADLVKRLLQSGQRQDPAHAFGCNPADGGPQRTFGCNAAGGGPWRTLRGRPHRASGCNDIDSNNCTVQAIQRAANNSMPQRFNPCLH